MIRFFLSALQTPPPPAVEFFTLPDPEPPRGILFLILESFFMIAVMLAVTAVVGVGVGFLRLWLLRRYPNNPFNGSGRDAPRIDLSRR